MPSPFSAGARERGGEEADLWVGWVGEAGERVRVVPGENRGNSEYTKPSNVSRYILLTITSE